MGKWLVLRKTGFLKVCLRGLISQLPYRLCIKLAGRYVTRWLEIDAGIKQQNCKFRNDLDMSIFAVSAALQSFVDRESIFTGYHFEQFEHSYTL